MSKATGPCMPLLVAASFQVCAWLRTRDGSMDSSFLLCFCSAKEATGFRSKCRKLLIQLPSIPRGFRSRKQCSPMKCGCNVESSLMLLYNYTSHHLSLSNASLLVDQDRCADTARVPPNLLRHLFLIASSYY